MTEQKHEDKTEDKELIKPLQERIDRLEKHLGINQPEKKTNNTESKRPRH